VAEENGVSTFVFGFDQFSVAFCVKRRQIYLHGVQISLCQDNDETLTPREINVAHREVT
jgi:hypothetical protein